MDQFWIEAINYSNNLPKNWPPPVGCKGCLTDDQSTYRYLEEYYLSKILNNYNNNIYDNVDIKNYVDNKINDGYQPVYHPRMI